MSNITTKALVIRAVDYSDNDKILTLLTPGDGKLTVTVKGAKSLKNANHSASQLMCYGEYTMTQKNGRMWLRESNPIENFFSVHGSIERHTLSMYVLEFADALSQEGEPAAELLSLTLNTLFELNRGVKPLKQIKAVFELRAISDAGFMPYTEGCGVCRETENVGYILNISEGTAICEKCAEETELNRGIEGYNPILWPVSRAVLDGMRYVCECQPKRVFAFSLPEEELSDFAAACEQYALNHIERRFKTLDFYKKIADKFDLEL